MFLYNVSLHLSLSFTNDPPQPPRPTHTFTCSCVHYSCEAIDCQEPLIRNAELKCSSPGRHFYNGDRCTISCNSGYVLQIHQDDDIIKSQVNTLLHMFAQSSLYKEEHGCIHIRKQMFNAKKTFLQHMARCTQT